MPRKKVKRRGPVCKKRKAQNTEEAADLEERERLLEMVENDADAHDLSVMMRQLEHWTHRLYPKMPFDEVLERLERLGNKKQVQTCVKKIRLDLPVLDDEFVGDDVERNDRDSEPAGEVPEPSEMLVEENDEDMWDRLLNEEREASQVLNDVTASTGNRGTRATPLKTARENIDSPDRSSSQAANSATPTQTRTSMSNGPTPEQLERIERNKQMARERRMKKHGIFSPASQKKPEYIAVPLSQHNCQSECTSSPPGNESSPNKTPLAEDKIREREATLLLQDGLDNEMDTTSSQENSLDNQREKSAAVSPQEQVSEMETNSLSQRDTDGQREISSLSQEVTDSQKEIASLSQGDTGSPKEATSGSNDHKNISEQEAPAQSEMDTEIASHGVTVGQSEMSEVLPRATSQNIKVGEDVGQSEMSEVLPLVTSQNIKVGEVVGQRETSEVLPLATGDNLEVGSIVGQSEMSEVLPLVTSQNIKVGEVVGGKETSEVLPPATGENLEVGSIVGQSEMSAVFPLETSQNIKLACHDQEDGQNWCTEGEITQDSDRSTMATTPSTEPE